MEISEIDRRKYDYHNSNLDLEDAQCVVFSLRGAGYDTKRIRDITEMAEDSMELIELAQIESDISLGNMSKDCSLV